ncbi:MAG: glycosyltransferase family 2 protein [Mobilitalea sp.]
MVPVFNTEIYLERCLISIINQTYKNLELILVDDGSTDRSGEICDDYAKMDKRIKVIHQTNRGQSVARNRAIDISSGCYMGFVDSDDYIEKDMFEILYLSCVCNNSDIAICGYSRVNEDGNIIKTCFPSTKSEVISKREAVYEILKDTKIYSFLWDKLFKKQLFESIRFPEGKIFEDVATVFRIAEKANKISLCPYSKYLYIIRGSSTINVKSYKRYKNQLEAFDIQLKFAHIYYPDAVLWIEYHIAEVIRSMLPWYILSKNKNVNHMKYELKIKYRKLLEFIWKSNNINLGKKIYASIISISPSGYIFLQQIKGGGKKIISVFRSICINFKRKDHKSIIYKI